MNSVLLETWGTAALTAGECFNNMTTNYFKCDFWPKNVAESYIFVLHCTCHNVLKLFIPFRFFLDAVKRDKHTVRRGRPVWEWMKSNMKAESRRGALQNKHSSPDRRHILASEHESDHRFIYDTGRTEQRRRCSQSICTIMAKINNECSCESKNMLTAHTLVLSFHTSLTLSPSLPYKQMLSLTLPRAPSVFFLSLQHSQRHRPTCHELLLYVCVLLW